MWASFQLQPTMEMLVDNGHKSLFSIDQIVKKSCFCGRVVSFGKGRGRSRGKMGL